MKPLLALAVLISGLIAIPASANAEPASWQRYVVAPSSRDVGPGTHTIEVTSQ